MNSTKTMKKWKFFLSVLKERDWLEEMASQGWLLTDMKLGIHYFFKKIEPCEKVFEIERFAVSANPTVSELNARKFAMDVATQSGWEMVTHDEDMNYYFVKDKAGDETDEFYDDEELRKERAERYRRRHCYEAPLGLLKSNLAMAILYIVLTVMMLLLKDYEIAQALMLFYIIINTLEIVCILGCIFSGHRLYTEFSLSREEWQNRKRYSSKRRFKKVQQMLAFLREQNEAGLSFTGCDGKNYLFEKDSCLYDYCVDTRACLMKRIKERGNHLKGDSKDWYAQDTKWYEMSIAEAAQYGFKPVAVLKRNVLIYKRAHSGEPLPWENGNEKIHGWQMPTLAVAIMLICGFVVGLICGSLILGYGIGV